VEALEGRAASKPWRGAQRASPGGPWKPWRGARRASPGGALRANAV